MTIANYAKQLCKPSWQKRLLLMPKLQCCWLLALFLIMPSIKAQEESGNLIQEFMIQPPSRMLTMNFGYGFIAPIRENIVASFSRGSTFNLMMGIKRFLDSDYDRAQLDFAHIFLVVSIGYAAKGRLTDTLTSKLTTIGFSNVRFGFGARDGIGYKFQKYAVVTPYISGGQAWISNQWTSDTLSTADVARLKRFSNSLQYTAFTEMGVMIDVGTKFAMDIGFESMLVQPRYIFLQSFSNLMLQQLAHIFFRKVIDTVFPNSWIPIAGFALKGAFNFWLYHQRSQQGNFPFRSEAGLLLLAFKVGASFSID